MNYNDHNFGAHLPAKRQTEIYFSESAKETIAFVVEKLREVYLEGKEIETEHLKIKAYQAEMLAHYNLQRELLMQNFQEQREFRMLLERMLKDAIAQNDHELKLQLLDAYKTHIKSLTAATQIQPFQGKGYRPNYQSDETIIEI
ncbi:hypothetical protein [Phaeodactylibacter xiamenensis]|uniref:hypothetical protein n=1 Tax=Phaeodactylibacter xiamenensis TaxID=1524460 RepID=UPI0024A84992|nr:hypothetical protein [Phaeodactylibacter xiamenensis]